MPDEGLSQLVRDMSDLLSRIDAAGFHPVSILAEAEGMLQDQGRAPSIVSAKPATLLQHTLDTRSLRWWLRGTDAGLALAQITDAQIVAIAKADGHRQESALDRLDEYADALAELVIKKPGRESR